ncbi:hypothetical protein FB451DRAFT_1274441 [Mycena latifolia]|nr:hypothetical protein FB451DRAFT_1274441 [Mycena latifolia]
MSSPFSSQLGTNYCPNDDEVTKIKLLLVEPSLRLERIDLELANIQITIDKLIEERNRIGAYVDAHRALISPFRRLPLDVIQEIFMACTPTHRNCVMSASEAPVLLGRICSSWRAISLSSPRLWARIHIVEPTLPWYTSPDALFEQKVVQRLEIAKTWLGRSGNCPLSISLESPVESASQLDEVQSPTPRQLSLFLQALFPFASRWQHIHLSISPFASQTLSYLTNKDVPILERLTINENPNPIEPQAQWDSFTIFRGSKLRAFTLSACRFNPSELPLRWERLNYLAILDPTRDTNSRLTCAMAVQILSQCPALCACRLLVCDDPATDNQTMNSVVEHGILQRLDLHCVGSTTVTGQQLFCRLVLPRLRYFRLRGHPEFRLAPEFTPFLRASKCLQLIDIHLDTFSKACLMDLFRTLPPTIQRLHVDNAFAPSPDVFDDDVLAILTTPPDDLTLPCPTLLELIVTQCSTLSDEALLHFIQARMSGAGSSSPLKHVTCRFSREMQVDIRPSLQPFIESGLKTTITHATFSPVTFSPWEGLGEAPR